MFPSLLACSAPEAWNPMNGHFSHAIQKNRSAMRTWGLMLSFNPFGWNAVLEYQYLGVELLQVRR